MGILHNNAKATTIITTYNRFPYLQVALFSVLCQTYTNQQIIIVNDNPNEEYREEVNTLLKLDPRIEIVHNAKNYWVSYSRNAGIRMSRWEYVRFIDDDDKRVDEDKIKKQLWVLQNDKNLTAIGSRYVRTDELGNILSHVDLPLTDNEIRKVMNFKNPMQQSSLCAPVAAIMKAGMYRESFKVSEDYDLITRLWKIWKLYNLPDYSLHYRIHQWLTSTLWHKMPYNDLKIILELGNTYPWFMKAVCKRIYGISIDPIKRILIANLTPVQISYLKKLRDSLK